MFSEIVMAAGDSSGSIPDAMAVGIASLGLAAAIIGIALFIGTIVCAMRGNTPLAIILGVALVTLFIGPLWMLLIAVVLLIIMVIAGNPAIAGQVFAGLVIGTIIYVVTLALLVAIGVVTSV